MDFSKIPEILKGNISKELFIGIFVLGIVFIIIRRICSPRLIKRPVKQGILGYYVCYADQAGFQNNQYGRLLHSKRYNLQGKPDYIFRKYFGRSMIPVEIKSGTIGASEVPHAGDRLQLAVYFLIIEDVYGVKPKQGRLVYSDAMFIIKNTKRIRMEAASTVINMRRMLSNGKGKADPSHAHCRYCLCRGTVCEFCKKL